MVDVCLAISFSSFWDRLLETIGPLPSLLITFAIYPITRWTYKVDKDTIDGAIV